MQLRESCGGMQLRESCGSIPKKIFHSAGASVSVCCGMRYRVRFGTESRTRNGPPGSRSDPHPRCLRRALLPKAGDHAGQGKGDRGIG